MTELDTRLVRCPNGCHAPINPTEGVAYGEVRQFLWWNGSVGTVRHCSDCGADVEFVSD